jgi:DoxX-like family
MKNNYLLLRLSLAAVWLLTAIASWAYPPAESLALLERVGLHGATAPSALYAGIVLDTIMGVLTLINLRALQKWLWLAQAVVILTYSIIIAIFLQEYALHPFGVLIKNLPMLAILWILWREPEYVNPDLPLGSNPSQPPLAPARGMLVGTPQLCCDPSSNRGGASLSLPLSRGSRRGLEPIKQSRYFIVMYFGMLNRAKRKSTCMNG